MDEEAALEQVPTVATGVSVAEPSRMTRVKSAVQDRIPFWGKKEDEQSMGPNAAFVQDNPMDNYTMDMVDVLDTIGTYYPWTIVAIAANKDRSGSCDLDIPDKYAKLAVHPQSSVVQ